jgi:hypothetical protein
MSSRVTHHMDGTDQFFLIVSVLIFVLIAAGIILSLL